MRQVEELRGEEGGVEVGEGAGGEAAGFFRRRGSERAEGLEVREGDGVRGRGVRGEGEGAQDYGFGVQERGAGGVVG